ncbi:MAG: S41 family peptidase [Deinococcales bacterium]
MKRKWLFISLIIAALSAFAVYAQFSSNRDITAEFENNDNGRALLQVFSALKSNYLKDVDDTVVIEGAIKGMIEALDDRYTSYTTAKDAARDRQDLSGSFEGIGVLLSPRDRAEQKIIEVVNVYRDGPAWNAGMKRGDIFAEVDGVNVEDFTSDEIVDVVRGPKGTNVHLGMRRSGVDGLVYFDIVRDTIEIIDVEEALLPNNVGYIRISSFRTQKIHEQLLVHLKSLEAQGATSLILDLRDNVGGLLNQGILVADEFLDGGDIVFQRIRGVTQRIASADPHAVKLPMVVLVNEHSASASEIVAAALQDNARAKVIGVETFGKGVGQSVLPLNNGGQFTFTSFEWLTPNRQSIHSQGITPDVIAEDTRFGNVISLEGQGAASGEEIEFVVNGEVIGKAVADEEGNFKFVQLIARRDVSEVPGEALISLEDDSALKVAYETLLLEMAQSTAQGQ